MTSGLVPTLRRALEDVVAESVRNSIPSGTPRKTYGRVWLPGKATSVIGMRRTGKTMFVHQLRHERLRSGVHREHLPYINFEDERLTGLEGRHLGFLLDEYARIVPNVPQQGNVLWSFDEIQVVPGWERFIRRCLDSGAVDVVVSGSSADLLSREIATSLRGRAWAVPIFPFGFAEYLAHNAITIPTSNGALTSKTRGVIEHAFTTWLQHGGMPETLGHDTATRMQVLRDHVDVVMLRDVVERHDVSNVHGLRWLVRHLLGNAGSLFSVEKFHGALKAQGVPIGRDALHSMIGYLEDCFLVRVVQMESTSERQRMVNPRKIYPVDQGFIPVFDRSGKSNIGHALETSVLIELERRKCVVTYVRTPDGHEVDFLARDPEGNTLLIQVCADASAADNVQREVRALVEAKQLYPHANALLLTRTRDSLPTADVNGITALPAYDWMLGI
jgi:predicted AAA+ superfamily ATPase